MIKKNSEILIEKSNNICHDLTVEYILLDLLDDLREFQPQINVCAYGSMISDLGLPKSNVNISLDCDNMYEGKNLTRRHQTLIARIAEYLSFDKQLCIKWKMHEVKLHSRIPIVKVQHVLSGRSCDISVANRLAVETTNIIKYYNRTFPLCRKMILFLKQWLHVAGLHFITSYTITWCVIFYLQTMQVFPSISKLIQKENKSRRINGWEIGISCNFVIKKLDMSFEKHLLTFFLYYANFYFEYEVVCPLLGRKLDKRVFTGFDTLENSSNDMRPYINYLQNNFTEDEPEAFCLSAMCVQDPINLSDNLTETVSIDELRKFQSYCKYSAEVLSQIVFST
nr:PREDICTED: speckle targeted PIP5K1A-regulated poly(A) polymerase-like [Linepithema humile]